jgi:Ca-activated chloride channel homolog
VSFANPWILPAGALAIAVLLLLVRFWRARRAAPGIPHPDLDMILAAQPRLSRRRHLPALLALLALAAMVVALAKPQVWQDEPRERATIMLAIDVSGSMAADDVRPYRLHAAQEAAVRFADSVPRQYRVGLVSFSGTANVLVPPSTDRLALRRAIEGLVPDGATAVGDAVNASLDAIRAVDGPPTVDGDDRLDAARILLLSDGSNTTGTLPAVAAERAAAAQVPVFTVSLGTAGGRLSDGTPVPPDPQEMQNLADATGGAAYESTDAESVSEVYARLGSFIGTERVRGEATAWAAGAAVLLLLTAAAAASRLGPRLG